MKRIPLIIAILDFGRVLAQPGGCWAGNRRQRELVLYGDVDLRQVELAFNDSERIAAVLRAGGRSRQARRSSGAAGYSRLEPQVAEAEATAAAQREVVARMHHGSRPQEIAEARANVASAEADAASMPADNTSGSKPWRRMRS